MLTDAQKLEYIRSLCLHPGLFDWSGRELAAKVTEVIEGAEPIPYRLSDDHAPIPYELVHDAAYEEVEE